MPVVALPAEKPEELELPSMPDLMTTEMLANALPGTTTRTLEDWRWRRIGPAFFRDTQTRRVYYLKTDVLAWLSASRHTPDEKRERTA